MMKDVYPYGSGLYQCDTVTPVHMAWEFTEWFDAEENDDAFIVADLTPVEHL